MRATRRIRDGAERGDLGPPRSTRTSFCALAVGGLDPGGGAGIAADLRAMSAAGAFGCAAVAVVTVQSTAGLRSARAVSPRELSAQVVEVLVHQRVRAVKVGALGSEANVRAVARIMSAHGDIPLVVDTPMVSSRGPRGRPRLLASRAVRSLREALLSRATLVTVNLDEARTLTGQDVRTVGEAHDAARALSDIGARAVLVKGGHMEGPDAIDILCVDREVVELRARRLSGPEVHGTGCALASLVAGRLACRPHRRLDHDELVSAIRWAKRTLHAAIARSVDVGDGMRVLVF
jgi:hydroxymethylpyrimidine/phosphomethylpyrimidine kinase